VYQQARRYRKTIRLRLAVLGLAAGLAAGCDAPPDPGPVPDPPGPSPLRIVSLSPDVSMLLRELGAGGEIVAVDGASARLDGLGGPIDLGTLEPPAVAAVAALDPDLAIGLADARVLAFAEGLREAGVRVVLLDPRSANEVDAAVLRVGALVGRETRARTVAAGVARDVSRIATARDGRSRRRVVLLVDCEPATVVGGAGLVHETLELAGAENVFHEPEHELRTIGAGELAARAPEWVLDASGREPAARCFDAGAWGARVVPVPPALVALPALDLLPRVRALHALLYERDT